jgi:CheY-like chemotaxis protein
MRKTILVVEDDTDLRNALFDVLESAGFEVLTAGDGGEALEILQKLREPALMLLDLKIPAADGYEIRSRLLESPGVSEAPVALLSADPKDRRRPRTPESARSLEKRFCKEELLRIVAQYCEA